MASEMISSDRELHLSTKAPTMGDPIAMKKAGKVRTNLIRKSLPATPENSAAIIGWAGAMAAPLMIAKVLTK